MTSIGIYTPLRIGSCITRFDLFLYTCFYLTSQKSAKSKENPYTLNDGMGLSLLIDTIGSKGWRFRYRFAVNQR